jgi:hypothetical protein
MNHQKDLITLAEAFQESANRHDIEALMGKFTEDAEFEIVGLVTLVGREQIRAIFEYDAGVNTELRFFNFRLEGNTVTCQVVERNDRLKAAGFDELLYTSCSIVFRERLIQKFTFSPQAESIQNLVEVTRLFLPWVQKNYPLDYLKLFTPEGHFIYNRDNGVRVVFLMKDWRTSKRE